MNMEYCRFRGTVSDIADCYGAIEDARSLEDLSLGEEEMAAFRRMVVLCESFVERATQLLGDDVEWEA